MRAASPTLLIDINQLNDLSGISLTPLALRIGALTRFRSIASDPLIAQYAPILTNAVQHIANPSVRHRGTVGGSVALAEPSAELPACLCALEAMVELSSVEQVRKVAATDFFTGRNQTRLTDHEILTAIEIPHLGNTQRWAFEELSRRRGSYALCGLAAQANMADRRVEQPRLVFFAVGDRPVLATQAMRVLHGRMIDDATIAEVQNALIEDLTPQSDVQASAQLRLHYAKTLVDKVLRRLNVPED